MEEVSYRYASALFSIAEEQNKLSSYLEEGNNIYLILKKDRELINYLSSYFLTFEEKEKIIEEVFSFVNNKDMLVFIKLVVKNSRSLKLVHIFKTFIKLANQKLGIAQGVCFSSTKLNEKEKKKIEDKFKSLLNKQIILEYEIDEDLLGGIKVEFDDKVFDGSLAKNLSDLHMRLKVEA